MHVIAQGFWLPKAGNDPDEYEDAFRPKEPLDADLDVLRVAIADGATETSFSGLWANMLVDAFVDGRLTRTRFTRALPTVQEEWWRHVRTRDLPWYAQEKLEFGAFSSLVGVILREPRQGDARRWDAVAVGDSCLFQIRSGELFAAFPMTRSDHFTSRPLLFSSHPAKNAGLGILAHRRGTLMPGDCLCLMTDALAHWFLAAVERGEDACTSVLDIDTADGCSFDEFIADLRHAGRIRNDDVTLLRVDCCW